jgi:hypothetical protein
MRADADGSISSMLPVHGTDCFPPDNDRRADADLCGSMPIASLRAAAASLFDRLVGSAEQWQRDSDAERLGGLEIDDP